MCPKNPFEGLSDEQKAALNSKYENVLDTEGAKVIEEEAKSLVMDFDKDYKEWNTTNKKVRVKIGNKFITIPSTVPMGFFTFYLRNCIVTKGSEEVFELKPSDIPQFLQNMLGKKFLETLEDSETTVEFVMNHVVPKIMSMWGMTGDGSKNVLAPTVQGL